jgi:oleate hydratase
VLSLAESNWKISLNIPHQPTLRSQTADTYVFSGYALAPEKEGNHVKKPMLACSGQEIMSELLELLNFPLKPILSLSVTIPCVVPGLTAPLLSRVMEDRPQVIPEGMTNLALLGQFVDIPGEPTGTLEYSVRGAEIAVAKLLGGPHHVRKSKGNLVMDFLDLLH